MEIKTYVDGSYDPSTGVYGYGVVAVHPDGKIETLAGSGNKTETAAFRNVAGEMLAAMVAVRYAIDNGFDSVKIFYDYSGIECWVTGTWKAKKNLTIMYCNSMRKWGEQISISFQKVDAHTGDLFNEMADSLAKTAISYKG